MSLQIIIRDQDKYRGRNISELNDNLVSEGWPPEIEGEHRDKIKWFEEKKKRVIRKQEIGRALNGKLE